MQKETHKDRLVTAAALLFRRKGFHGVGVAEILAAAMTGSTLSRDVKPLKAPEGAPHDLGQFYLIVDPGVEPGFAERLARLAEAVSADGVGRMPGQGRVPMTNVEVPAALIAQLDDLAG